MKISALTWACAGVAATIALLPPEPLAANPSDEPQSAVQSAPQLVRMDNVLLYRRQTRLGMVSQRLGYTLAISREGQVVGCELSRDFKRAFTTKQICKALAQAAKFNPARDDAGHRVDRFYAGAINLLTFFRPDR